MKHYYRPTNYYEVRFTQPIYSPVDGVILYLNPPFGPGGGEEWRTDYEQMTGKKVPSGYKDWDIFIRPDDAPNVWVVQMHVSPADEIVAAVPATDSREMMLGSARPASPGYRVKAGDLVGHGSGEISIQRHLVGSGVPSPCNSANIRKMWGEMPGCRVSRQFHSLFEFMTNKVFDDYQAVSSVFREDFIISAEERSSNPLAVDGESFVNEGVDDDPNVYVRLR